MKRQLITFRDSIVAVADDDDDEWKSEAPETFLVVLFSAFFSLSPSSFNLNLIYYMRMTFA